MQETKDQDDAANGFHITFTQTPLTSGMGQDIPPATPALKDQTEKKSVNKQMTLKNNISKCYFHTRKQAGVSPPGNSRCGRNPLRCDDQSVERNGTVWNWQVDTRHHFPDQTGLHLRHVKWKTGASACESWGCQSQECSAGRRTNLNLYFLCNNYVHEFINFIYKNVVRLRVLP